MRRSWTPLAGLALALPLSLGAPARAELPKGQPDMKSAGALAFGPGGVLFVGDTDGAAIFAIETGDTGPRAEKVPAIDVKSLNRAVADMLGTEPAGVAINDVAVNPASGNVYLSVSRGRGPGATPVLLKVAEGGRRITEVDTRDVGFAKAPLPAVPAPSAAQGNRPSPRQEAITDLALIGNSLYVAGLSNEEFASRLIAIPYPFTESAEQGTSVEIFHGAHGRFETRSPIRTFVPFEVKGEPHILAAYTCTPLVKVPVAALKPGAHVKGTTVAELGNRNRPLDMIVYNKEGKSLLLMANSSRGVMKIPTDEVGTAAAIDQPVRSEKQGIGYETIAGLKGITQLDKLDDARAVVLVQDDDGSLNLRTIDLP
jgi:hypothetical protein